MVLTVSSFALLQPSETAVSSTVASPMFSETFFSVLVYGALGGSVLGLVTLLLLILRDSKKGKIW